MLRKKINNKGMTTVEILISFVLVATISTTLYTTISNYNRKMDRESFKLEINKYKNILTKEIQDDIIKGGLINVQTREFHSTDNKYPDDIYIVNLELKDHSKRRLAVRRRLAEYYIKDDSDTQASKVDDYFMIYYGKPNIDISDSNLKNRYMEGLEEFPIPDVGEGENDQICTSPTRHNCIVKDLRLTNVIIKDENKVLSIFIGFQHIEEGTKYAINIVSPIDYKQY